MSNRQMMIYREATFIYFQRNLIFQLTLSGLTKSVSADLLVDDSRLPIGQHDVFVK